MSLELDKALFELNRLFSVVNCIIADEYDISNERMRKPALGNNHHIMHRNYHLHDYFLIQTLDLGGLLACSHSLKSRVRICPAAHELTRSR
jgi:hypothetical protein